ncbi:MAG: aromatic aminobenezylarsenical efflux permease ArsG family transporter, partial [Pseudomonadota bacterium]
MDEQTLPILSALWLGILTSVSPCPLASNIAAVSFISRDIKKTTSVLWAGASYVFGRILCYGVLGACISASLLNVPRVSNYLQMYMPKVIGPLLVLTGMVLLNMIALPFSGPVISQSRVQSLQSRGAGGALLLGSIFALAFCPVSAALFFGSLIPLAVSNKSPFLFPFIYGLGTGLPVIVCAVTIVFGVHWVSVLFKKITAAERFVRIATGAVL